MDPPESRDVDSAGLREERHGAVGNRKELVTDLSHGLRSVGAVESAFRRIGLASFREAQAMAPTKLGSRR